MGSFKSVFITAVKVYDGKLVIERKQIVNICIRVKCSHDFALATRQFWKNRVAALQARKLDPLAANLFTSLLPNQSFQIPKKKKPRFI